MRYFGYIVLALAGVSGVLEIPLIVIPVLALISAWVFSTDRRTQAAEQSKIGTPNKWVDGLYLFAIQVLIMFVVYAASRYIYHSVLGG